MQPWQGTHQRFGSRTLQVSLRVKHRFHCRRVTAWPKTERPLERRSRSSGGYSGLIWLQPVWSETCRNRMAVSNQVYKPQNFWRQNLCCNGTADSELPDGRYSVIRGWQPAHRGLEPSPAPFGSL